MVMFIDSYCFVALLSVSSYRVYAEHLVFFKILSAGTS